jgi:hypothetical protein
MRTSLGECSVGIAVALVGVCLASCTEPLGPAVPEDAGIGDAGAADDAAVWPHVGVRWTAMDKPGPPITGSRYCIVEQPPSDSPVPPRTTLLMRILPLDDGLLLRAGTGTQVSDTPAVYTFLDRLIPTEITVDVEEVETDGGTARRFTSRSPFVWQFDWLPQRPPLELQSVSLAGYLNADDLPTSDSPPMSGTMSGCFTPEAAETQPLETVPMSLREFLEECGLPLDCNTTGGGDPDGWTLEFHWQAEVVEIKDGEVV